MKLSELFDIKIGTSLDLNALEVDPNGINYISQSSRNNGFLAKVKMVSEVDALPPYSISIASYGPEAFVQPEEYYTAQNVFYAVPKKPMHLIEKLYYCECLKANKFKYNYGRHANRTLKDIEVPDKVPDWVYKIDETKYMFELIKYKDKPKALLPKETKLFKVTNLFDIVKGKGPSLQEAEENPGNIPYITRAGTDNGIGCFTNLKAEHTGNVLTVAQGGAVGSTFYQPKPFCSFGVIVLTPKFELTEARAMYLIPIFEAHKFRYNFNREWNLERMRETTIMLPVNSKDEVDWNYIDNLMKDIIN